MKTNSKLSAYIVRGSTTALLFSCVIVALCSAINLREQPPKARPPLGNTVFGANGHESGTLSFAERVAYERAIEDVYWRHRIWPKERSDSKPPLDAVMSQVQLEKKVADYLRKSQALEDYWQRPITAGQLQAEMDRMAKNTKQSDVLRELFDALGNDPFVIAECLARPGLSDRLLNGWYAYDERIHGELRRRAQADLASHPTVEKLKQLSGNYSETELMRSDIGHDENRRADRHAVQLNSREWDETVQKLTAMFGDPSVAAHAPATPKRGEGWSPEKAATITQLRTVALSPLQEDETRFYTTAILGKTNYRLKLVTISWPKEPLDSWLARAKNQMPATLQAATANYKLPTASDGAGCINDTWTATSGPPDGRGGPGAVWTGTEMIVWGGGTSLTFFDTGGRYNPATDSWTATNNTNAPTARALHTAVWSGSEMIIWGGYDGVTRVNTGGRYNPSTDSWVSTATGNAPIARSGHTAVWTGSEMIVWGGVDESLNRSNTGGRYNPGTNSWTATSLITVPDAREFHSAVWTGSEMIVWGGDSGGVPFNTGGKYNPSTNSWTATSTTNAPDGRSSHTAVWSGSEMVVWGGFIGGDTNTGGRYNPATDSWIATSTTDAPSARAGHIAVWGENEMIIWGGGSVGRFPESGGRYNPSGDSWAPTGKTPTARARHVAVWTGTEMIVWGGNLQAGFTDTGGKYDPITDSWTAASITNAPTGRELPTAVWTGSEMIVWGGFDVSGSDVNTGGRYNPITDSWTATSTANAPVGRESHTAIWTGSSMIIWGGYFFDGNDNYLNTGGRYSPATDSWTATSTNNAPEGREVHGAVWTGSEMIIWGGLGDAGYFDTGGRYNPATDSWTTTNTANAPVARTVHGATWTGEEMIIWGGSYVFIDTHYLNTGGRYNPNTDSWTATSITDAPEARTTHTAVWTGNEMIVWGGQAGFIGHYFNTGGRYDPSTDSWIATSTANAPNGRYRHTAVWTGNEMIVWGGILYSNSYTSTGGRYCAPLGSQLGNISTRAFVQTGDNVVIGGFIVQGNPPKRVIIRAIGPELGAPPYNVPNALADPTLELHDGTGALIASNDNWQHTIIGGIITSDQSGDIQNSGHAPSDGRESAIIAELPAGNYTAIARGVNNTTGVGLVEVYDLDG